MKTKLVYPVCVFFVEGEFFSHIPSVGEAEEFCENYIASNNLPADKTEVFMFDRKEWIKLLRDVKTHNLKFVIEKGKVCTYGQEEVEEDIDVDIDWMKEDNLESNYSASEIVKIKENIKFIEDNNISFLTDEIIATFPHVITKKQRKVKAKVKKDKLVTSLVGEKKGKKAK